MKPRSIFFFQAEDGLRYLTVTGVQTCALPISISAAQMTATVMTLLMTVAVIGAALIGQWPEAAVVIWLFGIAEMIEALSLDRARRSEEHTSELQSQSNLVCRLLLEKKK